MIRGATLRLVVFVSCAHALVHMYEQALPSVEQGIAADFFPGDIESGKEFTGKLSNWWRMLCGIGALAAGWLVDRLGSRKMLAVYLLGCGAACAVTALSNGQSSLFVAMVCMGGLASIYHPAGLALISHETDPDTRPKALGIHGIFGSGGIGGAPLIAGGLLVFGASWRDVYWTLCIPGVILGMVFLQQMGKDKPQLERRAQRTNAPEDHGMWWSFALLTLLAAHQGFIYSGVLSFLPRYLNAWYVAEAGSGWLYESAGPLSSTLLQAISSGEGNIAAGLVLWAGCFGQYLGARVARADNLERQLAAVMFGNAPLLAGMAFAVGVGRPVFAGVFALVHFMHQPLYNSLIAKYTPSRHRSFCYGLSFAMGFGLGSFGARFAGTTQSDLHIYGTLAVVAIVAGCLGLILTWMNRTQPPTGSE